MKTLITYYSRTGNTRKVGQMIAEAMKCDSDEIIETNKRTGIWGWLMAGKAGTTKELTKIEPSQKNPADYDLVVIGTPIHSWGLSAPVRTYLRENKGKFNKVAFFCTCGSSGMERAFHDMETESGGKPLATFTITDKELAKESAPEKIGGFIKILNQ